MISLKNILNEAESFTAINKDSGKVSVFKSKEARDSAIKQGTHVEKDDKAAKGGDSSAGKDVPKVNIFDKPKEEPKSDKSSEPDYDKYDNKSQTMTDFFKGNLSIDDLQKVAKKNFDSEIASEKDLDGFLNNKFMQDVMADEHGVDKDTLISKVKDLKTALFGGEKEEPKKAKFKDFKADIQSTMKDMGFSSADLGGMEGTEDFEDSNGNYMQISKGKLFDDPNKFAVFGGKVDDMTDASADNHYKSFNSKEDAVAYAKELGQKLKSGKEEPKDSSRPKDSTGDRAGNQEVNKTVRAKAKKLGITPAKLGKDEYKLKMSQAAVEALTDANFHSEARALIAKLEGKPEWAEKPTDMPDVTSDEYDEWRKTSVYSSKYYDADDTVMDLGTTASQESSWDGQDALDSIAFDLKMNGFKDLASTLQSVIKESQSTKLKDLV